MAREVGCCICWGPSHVELMCPVHGAAARAKRVRDQQIDHDPDAEDPSFAAEKPAVIVILCILGGIAVLAAGGALFILVYSLLRFLSAA